MKYSKDQIEARLLEINLSSKRLALAQQQIDLLKKANSEDINRLTSEFRLLIEVRENSVVGKKCRHKYCSNFVTSDNPAVRNCDRCFSWAKNPAGKYSCPCETGAE